MKKILILLAASLLFLTKTPSQSDPYNCLKRIKIKAIPYGQAAWVERTMPVYVHYKELTPKEVKKQLQADSARYNGWDYKRLENPSNKMDCAVKKSLRETITITTPNCNPQQLICCFQRAYGYALGEGTTTRWVRYVYER